MINGRKRGEAEEDEEEEDGDPKTKAERKPAEKDKAAAGAGEAAQLDELLCRLPKACTKDLIHQFAVDFCTFSFAEGSAVAPRSHKHCRKKLLKALFGVSRTSLELLPYYARLVAMLNPFLRELGPALLAMLEDEFHGLFSNKNQVAAIQRHPVPAVLCHTRMHNPASSVIYSHTPHARCPHPPQYGLHLHAEDPPQWSLCRRPTPVKPVRSTKMFKEDQQS